MSEFTDTVIELHFHGTDKSVKVKFLDHLGQQAEIARTHKLKSVTVKSSRCIEEPVMNQSWDL